MERRHRARLRKVRLLMLDVDGVLTDGRIVLTDRGDELKFFDVQDGLGITLLRRAGIPTVIVSAKRSRLNVRRAAELRVAKIYQNQSDKLDAFRKTLRQFRLKPADVCYVGDDLVDISPMQKAGLAVAVRNAVRDVRKTAHCVTRCRGGRGAVREVAEAILRAQKKWARVTARYRR